MTLPTSGIESWGNALDAFMDVEHSSNGTHNIPANLAKIYLSADQTSFPSQTWTVVALNTAQYNTGGMAGLANNRINIPSPGYYHVIGQLTFAATNVEDGKQYGVRIVNPSGEIAHNYLVSASASVAIGIQVSTIVYMDDVTDTWLKLQGYQDTATADHTVSSGSDTTFLAAYKVGA